MKKWELHGQKKARSLTFRSNSRESQKPGVKRRLIPNAAVCRQLKLEVLSTYTNEFNCVVIADLSVVKVVTSLCSRMQWRQEMENCLSTLVTVHMRREESLSHYNSRPLSCVSHLPTYAIAKLTPKFSYNFKLTFVLKVAQSPADRVLAHHFEKCCLVWFLSLPRLPSKTVVWFLTETWRSRRQELGWAVFVRKSRLREDIKMWGKQWFRWQEWQERQCPQRRGEGSGTPVIQPSLEIKTESRYMGVGTGKGLPDFDTCCFHIYLPALTPVANSFWTMKSSWCVMISLLLSRASDPLSEAVTPPISVQGGNTWHHYCHLPH